ncbi:MAG TPA: chloride channel protein, partial [Pirellulales bacterium]|nr:chloride channel protein [Pirellulales bacterium]
MTSNRLPHLPDDATPMNERLAHPFIPWAPAQLRPFWQRKIRDSEVALLVMSAIFGVTVGICVVAMEHLAQIFHQINFAIAADQHLSAAGRLAWWRVVIVPIIGGLLAGAAAAIIRRWRPHETVDAIEANALFGGKMSLIDSSTLAVLTIMASGFGASVGMEAGMTQLGGGLASRVGQSLRLRRGDLRTIVGCGAAAAIAAAFNAPLAGAFYAFELVIGSYSASVLAPISIAALFATLVVREAFGADPIFALDVPVRIASLDYALFALLGVVAAAIAIATMRGVTWIERLFRRLRVPPWLRPGIGGVLIALIATIYPEVLGSGHGAVQRALDHTFPAAILLGLVAAKGLASAISVGAGFRGGLFSSSLLLGGAFGGAAVVALQTIVSALNLGQGEFDRVAYELVGMGSMAAAIIGAPVTMILLVLELTGDFPASLGVTVGVIVASVMVRLTFGYSFATWRFHIRGVPIRGGYDIGWIQDLTVGRLMRQDVHTAPLGMSISEFRGRFPLGENKRVFIVDAQGHYRGIVVTADAYNPDLA